MAKYRGDPALRRPPSRGFQCQERIVTDDELSADCEARGDDCYDDYYSSIVAFECTVAQHKTDSSKEAPVIERPQRLTFWCREPSCGVLRTAPVVDPNASTLEHSKFFAAETAAVKEDDGAVDPSFFDKGYTAAGKTGFQVWPGSRLMVEALTFGLDNDGTGYQDPPALIKWQQDLLQQHQTLRNSHDEDSSASPLRILELGAGVGVVGASLAAASNGAQVLLTDLPTLVTESLLPNLQRNANKTATINEDAPAWLTSPEPTVMDHTKDDDSASSLPPPVPVPIGMGWVAAASLDWTQPVVDQQLTFSQCQSIDIIIACDCVWLVSMLDGLLNTVQEIFESRINHNTGRKPTLLMSFQRRDPKGSTTANDQDCMFTTVDRVIDEIKKRQWSLECLAWQPVRYDPPDGTDEETIGVTQNDSNVKEVFLFEIKPTT